MVKEHPVQEAKDPTMSEALAPLAAEGATITVAVGEDRRRGTLARIKIAAPAAADRARVEERIASLLGRYTLPHEVGWAAG